MDKVEKVARAKELLADIVNLPYELHAPLLRFMEFAHPEALAQLRAALAVMEREGEAKPVADERRHCNHCAARFLTVWERCQHEREAHTSSPSEAAIRADEREKCAKVADQTQREADAMLAAERDSYQQAYFNGQIFAAEEIATAIRARRSE